MRLTLVVIALASPAFAAAPPSTKGSARQADKTIREVAGTAEFLRSLPKRFGRFVSFDATRREVVLQFDGDQAPTSYPVIDEAEVKIAGWWGRLEQLTPGERTWAWLKTDRQKRPVAVAMLADDTSQQDMQGVGVKVVKNSGGVLTVKPDKGPERVLKTARTKAFQGGREVSPEVFAAGSKVFVKGVGEEAVLVLDAAAFELRRAQQRQWLRKRWAEDGLPTSAAFLHVFSGEMDLILDHEAMRWGRSLLKGDKVTLTADPPIACVVKSVQPWRERTLVRLVAKSSELADLRTGQRLRLKMAAPPAEVDDSPYPPDMGRPRSREERVEWFLASVYCTCGVRGDTCTGHFYTLASCNPNGCGQPNAMRRKVAGLIDKGLSDRQVFDKLIADEGPGLLQPHLLP